MKKCKYEQKYRHGLKRCLRDGSLRYCNAPWCPHFEESWIIKFIEWLERIRE